MNKDLTVGKPSHVLWTFCLPLFGSIVFQQLYNIADSWVAGKFIGQNALAAVGNSYEITLIFIAFAFGCNIGCSVLVLYNIADSWVAGKFIGQNALAAVGNSYEITLIFIAFAFGCNIGCSVLVSQLYGAKNYPAVKTAVSTAMITSAVVCGVLMLVGILGCNSLLHGIHTPQEVFQDSALYLDIYIWGLPFVFFYNISTGVFSALGDSKTPLHGIHTPQEVFQDSALYLDIYIWGLPFVFFYNISTGVFSALGDSKTPFLFLAISSLANIAVDILFVKAFHMGVAGVAWATFLCQGVSCILAVVVVLRRLKGIPDHAKFAPFSFEAFHMGVAGVAWATFLCQGVSCILAVVVVLRRLKGIPDHAKFAPFSFDLLKRFLVVAIPSVLQQSFISVGNILIQSVINGFGTNVMAGYSASVKLKAEQFGDHFLYHHWQWHFQLYSPKYRSGEARAYPCRIPGRAANGVGNLCAFGGVVLHLRPELDALFHGRCNGCSAQQWNGIFEDSVPVLFCRVGKVGCGWYFKRCWQNGTIHGGNLYGFDPAGSAGLCSVGYRTWLGGHLVRLADRLDRGSRNFGLLLPPRRASGAPGRSAGPWQP